MGSLQEVEIPGISASMSARIVAALWWPVGPAPVLLVSLYGYSDPTAAQLADLNAVLPSTLESIQVRGYSHVIVAGGLNAVMGILPCAALWRLAGFQGLETAPTCITTSTFYLFNGECPNESNLAARSGRNEFFIRYGECAFRFS